MRSPGKTVIGAGANRLELYPMRNASVSSKPAATPRNVQIKQGDHYSTMVTFMVLESGDVVNARVKRTSGNRDLDASALKRFEG